VLNGSSFFPLLAASAHASQGLFRSIGDFRAATELPVSAVAKLSEADAFASLPRSRRVALAIAANTRRKTSLSI
jgi:hypothetical protein